MAKYSNCHFCGKKYNVESKSNKVVLEDGKSSTICPECRKIQIVKTKTAPKDAIVSEIQKTTGLSRERVRNRLKNLNPLQTAVLLDAVRQGIDIGE